MVGSVYEQYSVKLPDVSYVKFHQIRHGYVSGHQNEVHHFHEVISDHVYCVEST